MSRQPLLRSMFMSLVAAGFASAVPAADFHVGASLGRSDYRIDTAGATRADTKDGAGKVFVGATLTPHLGVEAALFDLGRAQGSVDVAGAGSVDASAKVRGLAVSGVLSAPLGPVSVFAKAGLARVRARVDTSVATGLPTSESSWQPALGAGVSYAFDAQWSVRGEWERMRARFPGGAKDDVDLLSVGLAYRF